MHGSRGQALRKWGCQSGPSWETECIRCFRQENIKNYQAVTVPLKCKEHSLESCEAEGGHARKMSVEGPLCRGPDFIVEGVLQPLGSREAPWIAEARAGPQCWENRKQPSGVGTARELSILGDGRPGTRRVFYAKAVGR